MSMQANPLASAQFHHSEHSWAQSCATYSCEAVPGPASPEGPWGFCATCAFEVAIENGVLIPHNRGAHYLTPCLCNGSGWPPDEQPGPEVKPDPTRHNLPCLEKVT